MAELKKIIVDGVEHTLPEGGGGVSNVFEDVNTLPENPSDDVIYSLLKVFGIINQYIQTVTTVHIVDTLPTTGNVCTNDGSNLTDMYYNRSDNNVYGYVNDMIGSAFGIPAGWYNAGMLLGVANMSYGGVVDSIVGLEEDTYYFVREYDLYVYKGKWIKLDNDIVFQGEGGSSVVMNNLENVASGEKSVAEGNDTTASGDWSHAEGNDTTASGNGSHAEGSGTTASNISSHAEGHYTTASGDGSHAEGCDTTASGDWSHAEGYDTTASGNYSHSEGHYTVASESSSHAEGWDTEASGSQSHAEGYHTTASGNSSHAEGSQTTASGGSSHAEGCDTTSSGSSSHAEGYRTEAYGNYSHSEGHYTVASGECSHAQGRGTGAYREYTFTRTSTQYQYTCDTWFSLGVVLTESNDNGVYAKIISVLGTGSPYTYTFDKDFVTAEGETVDLHQVEGVAYGAYSHSEGYYTVALGENSHSEGHSTTASGENSHSEGFKTKALGESSHAEGWWSTTASGDGSHAEGYSTDAQGSNSHAEGKSTRASGDTSHAEGYGTIASGMYSHAEGASTRASGDTSHAEGYHTTASGMYSHAEGYGITFGNRYTFTRTSTQYQYTCDTWFSLGVVLTDINGTYARITAVSGTGSSYTYTFDKDFVTAEGETVGLYQIAGIAYGNYSHSEGYHTVALGSQSHAEGNGTYALGSSSHTEGIYTRASGDYSHAEGLNTIAASKNQHAQGKFNIEDSSNKYAHIVGNGDSNNRSNAHTLDWDGNAWFAGKVRVGGASWDTATELGSGGGGTSFVDVFELPENPDPNTIYRVTSYGLFQMWDDYNMSFDNITALFNEGGINTKIIGVSSLPTTPEVTTTSNVIIYVCSDEIGVYYGGTWYLNDNFALLLTQLGLECTYGGFIPLNYTNYENGKLYIYTYVDYYIGNKKIKIDLTDNDLIYSGVGTLNDLGHAEFTGKLNLKSLREIKIVLDLQYNANHDIINFNNINNFPTETLDAYAIYNVGYISWCRQLNDYIEVRPNTNADFSSASNITLKIYGR